MKERGTTFLLLTLVCLADMAFAFDAASSFIITGSTTQIAGTGNDLTLTATDSSGFPDTEYNGVKTLFFSAAPAPPDSPQRPTVSDNDGNRQEFGTATVILFNNGVATVNGGDRNGRMFLYRSGTFTISATDGIIGSSGSGDLTVTVTPGPLAGFDVSITSPQTAGKPFSGTNTIVVHDAFGNLIPDFDASNDNVTLTSSLSGTLSGLGTAGNNVLDRQSDFSNGVSDLSARLIYRGPSGDGTLLASASNNISGTSNPFTIKAADATQLGFAQQPTSTSSGVSITPAVTVQVLDQDGIGVAIAGVSVTIALGSGSGTLGGTLQRTTDANGLATFDDLTIQQAGTKQLMATASGLSPATSQSFAVSSGPASKLVIQTQPAATATAGAAFSPQPVVVITDAAGNIVSADNSTVVTAQEGSGGPGGLQGTLSVTAANGVAPFSDLTETKVSTITLRFTSQPALMPAVSNSIGVTASSASKVVFGQQPTDSKVGTWIAPPVTVRLLDAFNNRVAKAGVPITMTLGSGTGTVGGTTTRDSNDSGLASFNDLRLNSPGQKVLLASSNNLASASSLPFNVAAAAPAQLVFVQQPSDVQAGAVINPAVTIQLQDDADNNVTDDGIPVTLAMSGTGTLHGTVTRNSVGGVATFDDLSIRESGQKALTASSANLTSATSQTFSVTPGAPAKVVFVQQPANAAADAVISPPVTVQLRDAYDNSVATAGVAVTMALSSGTGTLTGTLSRTSNGSGLVAFDDLNIGTTGNKVLTASGSGLAGVASSTFTISAGVPADLDFVQQPTDAVAGAAITPPVAVRLKDSRGNDAPNGGVAVTLSLNGSGTLRGTVTRNTVNGVATFDDLTIEAAGNKTLTASSSGLRSKQSSNFTIISAAASRLVIRTQPSGSATAGVAFNRQPVIGLVDANGNPVTNDNSTVVTVQESAGGPGGLQGTLSVTVANGIAAFTNLAETKAGTISLQFMSQPAFSPVTSTNITVNPAPASRLAFIQEPSNAAAGSNITPPVTVQLRDAFDNDVSNSGVDVTMSLTSGAGTLSGGTTRNTNSSGLASFGNLRINASGEKVLTASANGLTPAVSSPFTIGAGAATRVVFVQQPTSAVAGNAITPAVTVQLKDASGNDVTTSGVAVAITMNGNGTLGGTRVRNTNNGLATFNDLTVNQVGSKQLVASSSGLVSATSQSFEITPGAAARLVYVQQPTNATAGARITPPVSVRLRDALDNDVPTAGVAVTMALTSGNGTLSGTVTRNTNGSGVASFEDLSINAPGEKIFTASSNGLTPAVSAAFTISVGAPASLVFVQQPTNIVSGGTMVPAVTVRLKDGSGNNVNANGVSVSLALGGTGTLRGTLTQATVNGVATFSNLTVDQTGDKTLTASSSGLRSVTSHTFTVSAGSPNQLAFIQQPGNTVAGDVLNPAVTVRVVDANANTIIVNGTPILLTVAGGDSILGTVSKNTVEGVATFDDVRLTVAGQKTLVAVSLGLPAISSVAFTVSPGAAAQVSVESAANGTGSLLGAQNVPSGTSVTAYAITRDAFRNFLGNVAADSWALQNLTGGVVASDLVVASDKMSARFTGRVSGSATLAASVSGLSSVASGVLTVTAGNQPATILAETAPDGSGQALGDRTLTAGGTVTVYAVARDSANNYVGNVGADQWSLQNPTGGIVQKDLTPSADKKNATFSAHLIGQARVLASAGAIAGTPSGVITVVAGSAAKIEASGGSSQEAQINTEFAERLRARVMDTFGNAVGGVRVTFTAPASGPGGTFSGGTNSAISDAAGVATAPAFTANSFSGTFTVSASASGVTTPVSFTLTNTSGSGANIAVVEGMSQATAVGTAFSLRFKVTVKDDAGNAVGGALVRFSAPASGPSGNFPSGLVDSARTSAAGEAVSSQLTANFVAGSYSVIASTESGKTVSIRLTNMPGLLTRFAIESDKGGRIDTQFVGVRFGIRLRALDAYDNAVTSFSEGIVISSTGDLFAGAGTTPAFTSGVLATHTVGFQKTGTVTIVATRSGGGASGTSNSFLVGNPRPVVHSLSPANALAGRSVVVELAGMGFLAGVTMVSFGDGIGTSTVVNNDTLMTVTLQIDGSASPGPRDVTVINSPPVGGVAFLPNGFTIGDHPRPSVTSIVPSSGAQLQALRIFVRGSNFLGNGFSHLYFTGDGITLDSSSVDSSTVVRADIAIGASASLGPRDIVVVNDGPGGGTDTLFGAFTVTAGVLAAPSLAAPPNGARSQASTVLLSWQGSPGASSYHVEVATDAAFTRMIRTDSTANTSYQLGPLPTLSVYYWHIRAVSGGGLSAWSSTWSFDNLPPVSPMIALNNTVGFPDLPSPSDYSSFDYRIVGLPGASNSRVNNFIPGTPDVDWRILWDNGGASSYLVHFDASQIFTFAPGRAFWMLKKGPWSVNVTIASAPIDSLTRSVLVPIHSGWNLITNPMTWAIPWSDIQAFNGTSEQIFKYEGLYSRSDNLEPYVGYYFFDDPANPLGVLKIPYGPALGKEAVKKTPPVSPDSWTLHIDLRRGKYVDQSTSLGVNLSASVEKDMFDYHKPRAFGEMPSVYFARPEWDSLYGTFSSDVRPPFGEKNSWRFNVASKGPGGGDLELNFRGIEEVPSDMEVYLVDEAGAAFHNLRQEGATYRFVPASPVTNLNLLMGHKDALAEELAGVVPRAFSLDQNYPNPFNPSTAIPVSLPVRADVQLRIYNVLGQEVKTLHSGALEAGRHVFVWDGTNSAGGSVSSGVYISRLSSGDGVRLGKKMLLLR